MKLFLAIFLLASAAEADPGVTNDEIVIGVCTALTGANQGPSADQVAGAKSYIEYINQERHGIHGRRIRLAIGDDAFNPEKAIECFNDRLKENMFALAFVNGTPTGAKYIHMSELNNVPIVGFNSGARFISDPPQPLAFSVRSSYDDEAAALVDRLWNESGVRRFAIFYEEDAFGASGLQALKAALKKHGAEMVAAAAILRDTPRLDEPIRQVRESNPQAVLLAAIPPIEAQLLKKCRELDWQPLFATISGKDDMIDKAGQAANGVVVMEPVPIPTDASLPGVALFGKLLKRYESKTKPTFLALEGFTEAKVLVDALTQAGKDLNRDRFAKALEDMTDMDVGLGPQFKIHYSKTRHVAFDTVFPTIARDGKLVPLKDWKKLKI